MKLKTVALYKGKDTNFACDMKCDKAWGLTSRPKKQLSEDENDYYYLSDDELKGWAPRDPGTYEGGEGKPFKPEKHNKWCMRECERCVRWSIEEPEPDLPDFSVKVYNMPWKHEGDMVADLHDKMLENGELDEYYFEHGSESIERNKKELNIIAGLYEEAMHRDMKLDVVYAMIEAVRNWDGDSFTYGYLAFQAGREFMEIRDNMPIDYEDRLKALRNLFDDAEGHSLEIEVIKTMLDTVNKNKEATLDELVFAARCEWDL